MTKRDTIRSDANAFWQLAEDQWQEDADAGIAGVDPLWRPAGAAAFAYDILEAERRRLGLPVMASPREVLAAMAADVETNGTDIYALHPGSASWFEASFEYLKETGAK